LLGVSNRAGADEFAAEELWKINVGSGFTAPPMTFETNGKQYVAIASGPSPAVVRLLREFNPPELRGMRQATVLYVFGLSNCIMRRHQFTECRMLFM
jgi:alcohol dehydrogenase (cytochrome c)